MNFPPTHPIWMWLYFGAFGTAGIVFFALTMLSWTRYHARVGGRLRSAARWTAIGYMFLFFAQWFACGVGGPPGNLLSSNPLDYNAFAAAGAASLSMFFSAPGWICLFAGQQRLRSDSF
jgi:hypothetical protein